MTKNIKLLAIMDPVDKINVKKDSTLAILLEASNHGWEISYSEPKDLYLYQHIVHALCSKANVHKGTKDWITFIDKPPKPVALDDFDVILMRKDPPFDILFLYTTYLLELAQNRGCFIVNNPRSIRDANEKLFAVKFPQCCPETMVSANNQLLRDFINQHHKIIIKGLNSIGGNAVFILEDHHPDINVTLDLLTFNGTTPIMAQRFIPEILQGDKRVLMINGKPYPYALSRIPQKDDFRGNLSQGAKGVGCELTQHDRFICEQVGPTLIEKELFFVGLDIIGEYLTEINVTSPTGIQEIEAAFNVNICKEIIDSLKQKIIEHQKTN